MRRCNLSKWKTVETKRVYADPWVRLRRDEVVRPDGDPGTYSVLETKGGVGVVAIDEGNRLYLVAQHRYPTGTYSWEVPKGAFESFDTEKDPLATAKRELHEEVGLSAKTWQLLASVHTLMGSSNDEVFLFLARDLRRGRPSLEGTEDIVSESVTFDDALDMVSAGKITDATSIAAIFLARERIRAESS